MTHLFIFLLTGAIILLAAVIVWFVLGVGTHVEDIEDYRKECQEDY